mgnify:FL=1
MAVLTRYRLAEQIFGIIEGGDPGAASSISINELIISVGQVINAKQKAEYFDRNVPMGESIPNGTVLGLYQSVAVVQDGTGYSKATLPIKPLNLPRNMGVWSVYPSGQPENEFIPLQMGQNNLLRSQPMINDLLGQVGYETLGATLRFTQDLTNGGTVSPTVDMRLAVLDMDQYDDYTMLPIPPEWEWDIIKEVYGLYTTQPIPDKVVDSTTKELIKVPINDQRQPQ